MGSLDGSCDFSGPSATNSGTCASRVPIVTQSVNRKRLNSGIAKNRKWEVFQTVNHSRIVWDPKAKTKGLLGGHLNIRSILSKSEQIQHLLLDSNLDFLCLSETWLNQNAPLAALNVPGYNIYRKDREGSKKGGGVVVYIKSTLECHKIQWSNCTTLECLGLNISLSPQMSFVLVVIYRPPSADNGFYENFEKLLKESNLNKEILIMGDFNINWEDKPCRKKLKLITDRFDLTQVIRGPTRITNSTKTQIDLIFTNRPERIVKSFNMLTGLSDHNLTLVNRKLNKKRFLSCASGIKETIAIPKSKIQNFIAAVNQIQWDEILPLVDYEKDSQIFLKTLEKTIKEFSRKIKDKQHKNTVPWINPGIIKLMKMRDQALKIANKTKLTHDRGRFTMLRNKVVRTLRQAKADFFLTIIKNLMEMLK